MQLMGRRFQATASAKAPGLERGLGCLRREQISHSDGEGDRAEAAREAGTMRPGRLLFPGHVT